MSSIMGQIESEHPELLALEFGQNVCNHKISDEFDYGSNQTRTELSALELENAPYLTLFTLASANIDQSVPNLATIYIPIKSQMSWIIEQIESEHLELFALEFGKIA